ncbi:uncharacterized protein [Clytia hemisphaerica]|uniref:uncharacterized protein n=1 Tax=Clytia hemisphaerica TaxID=252671 RepID=UPI0034D5E8C0
MANLIQELIKLAPRAIDPSRCTSSTSLHQQITTGSVVNQQKVLANQDRQFNVGNGQTFQDPILAAEYLLEREYGESFVFDSNHHEPIFIPSEFVCSQYFKESSTADLEPDIENQMRQTLENLKKQAPKFWLTKDLDVFLQTQKQGSEIDQTEYEKWILKVKVMYLLTQELDVSKLNLPMTTSPNFTQECIKELNSIAPSSSILNILTANKMKVKVEKQIAKLPPQDPILSWFINLKLASRGEKNERSFFEKLFSLKNDEILQDILVLSSVNFMTDVTSQMHQEFDMLIFSWSCKLIIGVEVKRTLTSKTTAFKQLNKYHSALEKQLGDQLGPGWSFHPVICVEKNTINFSNHHFIDLSTDLRTWLSNVLNNKHSACQYRIPHPHPLEQLKKVLQLIVFSIHMSTKDQPRPITTTYLFEYVRNAIDSLSNTHNIVFYSKQQLPVISSKDPCYNKVIFMAGFGTGKTFLLFEKAMILSKNDTFKSRILYVICNGEGLLYHDRKAHLEEKGITVITGKSAIESLKMPWIRQHFKAIFFDEWNEDVQQKIDVKWLDDLPVCWIAPNSAYRAKSKELSLLKIHFKGFEIIHLTCNLRNTKEIVKKTKSIAETQLYEYAHGVSETPVNFLIGSPAVHVSSFGEAIFEERLLPKPKEGLLLVSDSVNFPVPPNEQVKFFHSSRNDFNNDENPCDFLRQGNVLVVSRNYVSGFEWPVVVYENAECWRKIWSTTNVTFQCDAPQNFTLLDKILIQMEQHPMLRLLACSNHILKIANFLVDSRFVQVITF